MKASSISYRLKQIDFDGSFEYSQEVVITNLAPNEFALEQNYPNPFNPITRIKYSIPSGVKSEMSEVKLIIYDLLGREIEILVNEEMIPGVYEVVWNAADYSSGIYYYQLKTDNFVETKKMLLLK